MTPITRRDFLKVSALGAASFLAPGLARSAPAAQPRPNFVFFLADDLGWADLACTGSAFYETPHLDRFRASGMHFTKAYAACPVCSPTRASILTGKYPARTGITDWIGAPQPETLKAANNHPHMLLPAPYVEALPLEEVTIAEALKEAGYATGHFGKWHLMKPKSDDWYPESHGFEVNKGGCWLGSPPSYFSPYKNPKLEDGPAGEHLPDRLAAETVRFIEANRAKPFFASLWFHSVHTPLQGRPDLVAKYKEKLKSLGNKETLWDAERDAGTRLTQDNPVYAAMVEAMDAAVGKVLDGLDRLGLAGNTVVIFMSDNGGLSTAMFGPTSNAPLRAGKAWLYEGGIREPLLVRWPGVTKPGSTCDSLVTSTDFYPTMLELAGLPPRPAQHVDGQSFAPLLRGETRDRGPVFWHFPHYSGAGAVPGGAVREGDWKLIEWYETGRLELFNLKTDPYEKNDLSRREPDKARALHDKLRQWRGEVGARMPEPDPAYRPGAAPQKKANRKGKKKR